jgi:hypothetical protein
MCRSGRSWWYIRMDVVGSVCRLLCLEKRRHVLGRHTGHGHSPPTPHTVRFTLASHAPHRAPGKPGVTDHALFFPRGVGGECPWPVCLRPLPLPHLRYCRCVQLELVAAVVTLTSSSSRFPLPCPSLQLLLYCWLPTAVSLAGAMSMVCGLHMGGRGCCNDLLTTAQASVLGGCVVLSASCTSAQGRDPPR